MNLYVSKLAAEKAASEQELAAVTKGRNRGHSSGWLYKRYGARRFLRFFWRVVEV